MKPAVCGVPQGSILGPLLILLYINDASPLLHAATFPDDTAMFYAGPISNCTVLTK